MMNLATYLEEKRISRSDFGRLIGKSGSTVSRMASGAIEVSVSDAFRIEQVTCGQVPARSFARGLKAEVVAADCDVRAVGG